MTKRTFLVTGASKGIGRALSAELAEAGHHVVGIARGKDPRFPGTLESIDLFDTKASAQALANLAQNYAFDGVINNVALFRLHDIGEINLGDVDDVLKLNLHPAIQTVQAILPTMREKGWGRIVNISSLTVLGVAQRTAYAASKAALNSFTRTGRLNWRRRASPSTRWHRGRWTPSFFARTHPQAARQSTAFCP
jgi:NAD(P)-dependent dehydrogenase (short-subunit alcohol dehydrogenase family)